MRSSCIVAAVLFAALIAAPDAFAFTFDEANGTNPDGSAHYADPDDQPLPPPLGGMQIIEQGNRFDEGPAAPSAGFPLSMPSMDLPGWLHARAPGSRSH
jgi:hypothetical protein